MNYIAFTICSNNYLSQALTLGQSLIKHNAKWSFIIGLVDKLSEDVNYSDFPFKIVSVEEIGIRNFGDMFLRYDIVELNTAVKPYFFKYLFSQVDDGDSVVYFDPDIYIYHRLDVLEDSCQGNDIVITPHITQPIPMDEHKPAEEEILNSGLYNLGFISIRNSNVGRSMVDWWAERLEKKAYIDFEKGYFTDQIWINFVPLYYEKVFILTNAGYNVAYWNLHERTLTQTEKGLEVRKGGLTCPLTFFHFSGYHPFRNDKLSKYQDRYDLNEIPILKTMCDDYSNNLLRNDFAKYNQIDCFYKTEKDKYIKNQRRLWLKSMPKWKRVLRIVIKKIVSDCAIDL